MQALYGRYKPNREEVCFGSSFKRQGTPSFTKSSQVKRIMTQRGSLIIPTSQVSSLEVKPKPRKNRTPEKARVAKTGSPMVASGAFIQKANTFS